MDRCSVHLAAPEIQHAHLDVGFRMGVLRDRRIELPHPQPNLRIDGAAKGIGAVFGELRQNSVKYCVRFYLNLR